VSRSSNPRPRTSSCDGTTNPATWNYRVWGDFATEDFHFYPGRPGDESADADGPSPGSSFETNELIFFTPQSGYPFDYLPANLIDILWPRRGSRDPLPVLPDEQQEQWNKLKSVGKDTALLHRIRLGRDDRLAAIQYSPWGCWHDLPGFAPFYNRGALVTPMYWGGHWPLSRGYTTGLQHQRPDPRDARTQLFDPCGHAQAASQRDGPDARRPREDEHDDASDLGLAHRHDRCRRRGIAAMEW